MGSIVSKLGRDELSRWQLGNVAVVSSCGRLDFMEEFARQPAVGMLVVVLPCDRHYK